MLGVSGWIQEPPASSNARLSAQDSSGARGDYKPMLFGASVEYVTGVPPGHGPALAIGVPRATGPNGMTGAVWIVDTATWSPIRRIWGEGADRGVGFRIVALRGKTEQSEMLAVGTATDSAVVFEISSGKVVTRRSGVRSILGRQRDSDRDGVEDIVVCIDLDGETTVETISSATGESIAGQRFSGTARWLPADYDGDGYFDLLDSSRTGEAGILILSGRTGELLGGASAQPVRWGSRTDVPPAMMRHGPDGSALLVLGLRLGNAGRAVLDCAAIGMQPMVREAPRPPGAGGEYDLPPANRLARGMLVLADIDHDGVDDVVASTLDREEPNGLTCYSGKGSDVLWTTGRTFECDGTGILRVPDLDRDGLPDIAFGTVRLSDFDVPKDDAGSVIIVSGKTGLVLNRLEEREFVKGH